jgi:hypothetical protein
MKITILISIFIQMALSGIYSNDNCCFQTKKAIQNKKQITLYDFDDFNELKFDCSNLTIKMSILQVKPNKKLILDNKLAMKNLTIQIEEDHFLIVLRNFKGFNLNSNPFGRLNLKNKTFIFYMYETNFDFYQKSKLIDNSLCNNGSLLQNVSIIKQINVLMLKKSNIIFKEVCPFIFKNTKIFLIDIENIYNSVISKNIFQFIQINNHTTINDLNATIIQLQLTFYHADLNSKILDNHVFEKLQILDLNGIIKMIQPDVFKNLHQLQLLRIRSENVKNIFARNNKWLSNINVHVKFSGISDRKFKDALILVIYQSLVNVTYYDYPDHDFCYFYKFPHKKLVLPVLKPMYKSKCTCTELYLMQFTFFNIFLIDYILQSGKSSYYFFEYTLQKDFFLPDLKCFNSSFSESYEKCNFLQKFNICAIKTAQSSEYDELKNKKLYFYIYDWIELSNRIQILFKKYINITFIVIAILSNCFMFIILLNLNEKMYSYLRLNSIFNFFNCLISLLGYVFSIYIDDFIDLNLYESLKIQSYIILAVKFFNNTLKTCSNITHFSFTLSRYKKINDLNKINGIKSIGIYLFLTLFFSCIINLFIIFEYTSQTNKTKFHQIETFKPYNVSDYMKNYKLEPFTDYKENFTNTEYMFLNIFQYLKIIFSDLSYILAIIIVDLMLFISVKKKMKDKRQITTNRNNHNNNEISNKLSTENRISRMIILNSINYFILRFPIALLSLYIFIFRYDTKKQIHLPNMISYFICKKYHFCESLGYIFYFFYLISYLVQFLIFFKLDKNFKESYLKIKNIFKYKFSRQSSTNNSN